MSNYLKLNAVCEIAAAHNSVLVQAAEYGLVNAGDFANDGIAVPSRARMSGIATPVTGLPSTGTGRVHRPREIPL